MSYFRTCPKCRANLDPGEKHICEPASTEDKTLKEHRRVLNADEIGHQLRQLVLTCKSAEIN